MRTFKFNSMYFGSGSSVFINPNFTNIINARPMIVN